MISRTIVPIIDQHGVFPGAGSQSGLGDVVQSLFFSPKALADGGWTWGIGPVLLIPTATDDLLGGKHWGADFTASNRRLRQDVAAAQIGADDMSESGIFSIHDRTIGRVMMEASVHGVRQQGSPAP